MPFSKTINRLLIRGIRALRFATLALALFLALPSTAWAQPSAAADSKSYANQYIIVLALIGLAVFIVCKPTKRADRPKRQM